MELHPEKKRKFDGPTAIPAAVVPAEPGKDESNVGNQLLAKMGWKSGTGLGAEGAGRVEPIKVQQFAERAGLGASQGHAAGSWTGAGGRAQQAHDVVRFSLSMGISLTHSHKRDTSRHSDSNSYITCHIIIHDQRRHLVSSGLRATVTSDQAVLRQNSR